MTHHAIDLPLAAVQTLRLMIDFGRPMTASAVGVARGTGRGAAWEHLRTLLHLGLICGAGKDRRAPLYAPTPAGRSLRMERTDDTASADPRMRAKTRNCLGPCRTPFLSSWCGERICPDCKSQTGWQSGLGFG